MSLLIRRSKGLRKSPMPHIYQPIIHRRDQFGKGSLKQVGHSVKFVQFTYRESLLSDTSAHFKDFGNACTCICTRFPCLFCRKSARTR